MIKTFIHEIDKQITSNSELFNQTRLEIFKKRIQMLEAKKSEIINLIQSHNQNSS